MLGILEISRSLALSPLALLSHDDQQDPTIVERHLTQGSRLLAS